MTTASFAAGSRRGRTAGRAGRMLAALVAIFAAPWLPASPYGVNVHIPSPEVLDAVAASGARWVRIDFSWSLVEPARGEFAWETYDVLVDGAVARGLNVYATISDTPAWATDGTAGSGVPRNAADFYDLCFRAASRYRGRIDYWGMWNEPNQWQFWAGSRDQYVDLILHPGAQAAHAASPTARVCGPELAHLQSAAWDTWLRGVLARASGDLDVVTHHLYPSGSSASSVIDQLDRGSRYPWDPPSVKKVLQDAGWFGRPFWLTETGCPSGSSAAGEAAQASFVNNLFTWVFGPQRAITWVDRVFLYEICDDPRYPAAFGLLGPPPAYAAKAAYIEVQRASAELPVDDASIVLVDMPGWLPPGALAHAAVTVRNTGTTTWTLAAGYRLAATGDEDPLAAIRHDLSPGEEVAPGEAHVFTFDVTAPTVGTLAGQPLVSDWRMIRDGAWRFGDTATATVAVSTTPPGSVSYLPFAMSLVDAMGRTWRSDVVLHNRGTRTLSARVSLLLPGEDNGNARAVVVAVSPGTVVTLADVVGRQLGAAGPGVLRVEADSPDLLAGCTTVVSRDAARFGAYSPATPSSAAAVAGGEARLLLLERGADAAAARSDLMLANPGGEATTVGVDLVDGAGDSLGGLTFELPPLGVVYRADVLSEVTSGTVAHAQVLVHPSPAGGPVLAWSLTSDGRSGDPTIAAPQPPLGEPFLLAPADGTSRLRGGAWRTSLQLVAESGNQTKVAVKLLTPAALGQAAREVRLSVAGGAGTSVADALGAWFGYRGSGALLVTPLGGAVSAAGATELTRVPAPYGESFPALPVGGAAGDGAPCRLFPITRVKAAGGTQTHLGMVNLGATPLVVNARIYDATGAPLAVLPLRLAAGEWQQLPDVLKAATAIDGQGCYAVLRSATLGGRFLAYATVVDGSTGDPVYVPCV